MSGDGQADAGSVKVEWWRAGSAEWPTEARARGERVAVEYAAWLALYREWCPGCDLVEAFPYWRDWFAEARAVALAVALAPLSEHPAEETASRRARWRELVGELLAWDIESAWCGVLSLETLLPPIPEDGSEWDVESLWVEARVNFEGVCWTVFGLWQGLSEGGKNAGGSPNADEIAAAVVRALEARDGAKSGAGKGRGKSYPPATKAAVWKFVDEECGGDLRGIGLDKAYTRFVGSPHCTPEILKHVGDVAAFMKVLEAARQDVVRGLLPSGG